MATATVCNEPHNATAEPVFLEESKPELPAQIFTEPHIVRDPREPPSVMASPSPHLVKVHELLSILRDRTQEGSYELDGHHLHIAEVLATARCVK